MEPQHLPLAKAFDRPFISLDETNIEMASILFLFLAVLAILHVTKGRQVIRHIVQIVSFVVFFYLIYSCLGVFGMIRNSLHGVTLLGTVYSESFYWMALPAVVVSVTLFVGPIFCGWICPTGTIQEFATKLRRLILRRPLAGTRLQLVLLGISLAGFVALTIWISVVKQMYIEDSSLHWVAVLILLCYLVLIGVLDDLPTRSLRLLSILAILVTAVSHVTITSPVHFAFTSRTDPASALSTLVIAAASLVVARAWCRYLCPWGYLMGLLARASRLRIVRNDGVCGRCNDCTGKCDVGAIDARGVRVEHCQFCFNCVDTCSKNAMTVVDTWRARARGGEDRGLPIVDTDTVATPEKPSTEASRR